MARTTLDLDDKLISDLMELTAARTKKAAIEDAVRDKLNRLRRERLVARLGSGDMDMTLEELKAWRRSSQVRTFDLD